MNTTPRWTGLRETRQFINPVALRAALPDTVTVNDDGTVTLFGDTYTPVESIPAGTVLRVSRGARGNLSACPADEVARAEAERAAEAAAEAERRRFAVERERRENRVANERLNIPVAWLPEANPYMTTEWNGPGGRMGKRGAVFHVRLIEDLHDGRLRRSKGETLCSGRSKWGDLFAIEDRDPTAFEAHQVTCRACLATAARWS